MKSQKVRRDTGTGDRIFVIVMYIILILLLILMLYPLIFVVSASFSNPKAVAGGDMILWPVQPSLDGYRYLMQYTEIWTGYVNTVFYTFLGTVLNLAATLPCAYAMSRRDLKGRGFLMVFFMVTMYFSDSGRHHRISSGV